MEEGSLTTAADIRERNRRHPARISPRRRRSACRCLLVSRAAAASIGTNLYGYAYDTIGNRLWSAENTYTANNLNQYTSILCASALPREISHDADGNMTSDGVFTYTYDSASRLTSVSSNGILLVTNQYDCKGRRVRKTAPTSETTFLYDGWNLIYEREIAGTVTNETYYYWGKDISGSLQGAGGVGGLLYLKRNGTIYVPHRDANGNIVRYIDTAGNVVAEYTYGAFGNTLSATGALADVFHFRFSTKYLDLETDLYYYGYRFYSPVLMRWLNRDPIEEAGGENLYSFCRNDPTRFVDIHGLGRWNFNDSPPPDFIADRSTTIYVSYEMDEQERKCCKGVRVYRYVRRIPLIGKILTGGQIGPYSLDGEPHQFEKGYPKSYAPGDWPEGPGVGMPWADAPMYRISWSWDFLFEAKCDKGPRAGEVLSTQRKLYYAEGHKEGDNSFKHGFQDAPPYWPDLTAPVTVE